MGQELHDNCCAIYMPFWKNAVWVWGLEQELAMDTLKMALTQALALARIDYAEGARDIILVPDASKKGWGAVLMQLDTEGRRHPSRYQSRLWNKAESEYDVMKCKFHAVLKVL